MPNKPKAMSKKHLNLGLTILLVFFTSITLAQVTKFRTNSFSMKTKNEKTKQWTKWSEAEKADILITIDIENNRIKIFSKGEQVYDIIKYYEKVTDDEGDETIQFQCVNEDGLKCIVRFVILNSREGRRQLYVDFADVMIVYSIYKLD